MRWRHIALTACVTGVVMAAGAGRATAETQIKPFIGVTFAGRTTFVDLEDAAGSPNVAIGASAVFLRDLFGVDVDVARMPGFFQSGDRHLVLSSAVTTVTGNVVLTLPRRMTEYTLRPYVVAGAGLMRVHIDDLFDALPVSNTLPALDFGAGATGFLGTRYGVSWEVRRFSSLSRDREALRGVSVAAEELSFWRASMALAIRY